MGKRRFGAITLTLHNNVCLGESPKRWGGTIALYGRG